MVDRVVIRRVGDPSAARIMLEKGEVDIAESLTEEQFTALGKVPGLVVKGFDRPVLTYLTMDVSQKPFSSRDVRRAVAHAINYDEMIQRILHGNAKRLHGLMTYGMFGADPSIPLYPYDVAKARQLLKDAGYPNGFSTELTFAPGRAVEFDQVAEYIQAYLAKVGVEVKLERTTIENQVRKMGGGNYGLSLMIWKLAIPDPDDGAGILYDPGRDNSWVRTFWKDEAVAEKMKKTRETASADVRKALYREVSMTVMDQVIYVPLYQPQWLLAWRASVQGVAWNPFMGVNLWKVQKK
jgi:ABC-type transport system substrate-binding protein